MNHALILMVEQALASLRDYGYDPSLAQINKYADLRYKRQASELTIPLPQEELNDEHISSLHDEFDKEYEKTFAYHFAHMPLEVIHLRVSSTLRISKPAITGFAAIKGPPPVKKGSKLRKAYFGPGHGLLDVPVLTLEEIGSIAREGPILIDTYDTTIVVPPDCRIGTSSEGSLIVDIQQ
jgi:N-methylhydantoinase A